MAARQARHTSGLIVRYVEVPNDGWTQEILNAPETEAALQQAGETHAEAHLRRLVQESKMLYEAALRILPDATGNKADKR